MLHSPRTEKNYIFPVGNVFINIINCAFKYCFTVHLLNVYEKAELVTDQTSFEHLLVTEGSGRLEGKDFSMDFTKGDSIFIPAGYGRSTVTGNCLIIKTRID